jgi:hypothetical protein
VGTYDPAATLAAITDSWMAVVAIGGLSIVAMFVYFVEAARMGARDKAYPMALWMTVLWWPHDGSYLLHFQDWFGGSADHWFMKLFWFAIVVTFLAESTFFVQTIRYARDELSPGLSQAQHTGRMFAGLVAGVVSWVIVKDAIADPLYLLTFMLTLLWGGPSGSALLGRRPDASGQSVLEWIGFTTMAVMYSITSIFFFGGGFFQQWPYVLLCVVSSAWSAVHLRQVWRSPAPLASWTPRREVAQVTVAA